MTGEFILDTNILRPFFQFYTPYEYFPEIWSGMWDILDQNKLLSVTAVKTELDKQIPTHSIWIEWKNDHNDIFLELTPEESVFLETIFTVERFRLTDGEIAQNKTMADPYLVAKAKCMSGCVVTDEKPDGPAGRKIPDICRHFDVQCINRIEFIRKLRNGEY